MCVLTGGGRDCASLAVEDLNSDQLLSEEIIDFELKGLKVLRWQTMYISCTSSLAESVSGGCSLVSGGGSGGWCSVISDEKLFWCWVGALIRMTRIWRRLRCRSGQAITAIDPWKMIRSRQEINPPHQNKNRDPG